MGEIIGDRFKIIRSLGRGGMGEIYLADDNRLGMKVALKRIGGGIVGDGKARFLREVRAASRLDHPNICAVYGVAAENGEEYIVMQYVDGVTLGQLLKMKPLSLERVLAIATQIADGLAAAHGRNIVHRDIKPGNIMIDRGGRVKILDFGLAQIFPAAGDSDAPDYRSDRDLAEKGMVLGTAAYMSPEQARGLKLDGRSDIFSYGVVLYELIENRNPFADDEDIVTLYNILHGKVRFSRPAPAALRAVVQKALRKDRGRRYRDFGEIRKDLAAVTRALDQSRDGMANLPDK